MQRLYPAGKLFQTHIQTSFEIDVAGYNKVCEWSAQSPENNPIENFRKSSEESLMWYFSDSWNLGLLWTTDDEIHEKKITPESFIPNLVTCA